MPISAGKLRELLVIETPTEARNALGETTQTWSEFARRRCSVDTVSYSEQSRRGQIGGSTSYQVNLRYLPGLTGSMRLVWPARGGLTLYISSVVERGNREEHELTCEAAA